ncbi:NADPH:quinone reductase-like Zn-dependent oxidoreductase [Leclercia adecarboxylata]|jgi:NADPH:quinone reductase-like Zn-dependent oxidoreductase|uniref:zinc-dependent alcohol dehydrogenase family protein n=1 Tax=Leclercia adecarboxylata TaxID=83655 RepID=UPI002474AAD0|nr:zinc-dependent alcohol dehydrogenase family protein [Leclercia adecarboxylata]MDH6161736.1 NADPH:quinone reductase-like Zn-dependent oxidoreductase [Leclercia adecarboxylata]MDU1092411.1 zinc-dependent alcohol dehydrogenase family protein [Leclercia adecarboxylata]
MSKIVVFNQTGSADVLEIKNVDLPAPSADEVQIAVRAIGINRAEIMYRTGQYVIEPQFPARLGYEAAGVVTAVGAKVTAFRSGDIVSVIPAFSFSDYGMYGEVVNAPAHAVVKHPQNLSFEQAAASWMMYVTAYGALVEYGEMKKGDHVLINAASSSVGLAAIQIARMRGAIPIAMTRTSEKRALLLEAGATAVIASKEQNVADEINRITEGKGLRIVFDPVGGPDVAEIAKVMSDGALFFQYGALDSRDLSIPVFAILGKHLTFRGYELFEITTNPEKLARAKAFVSEGLGSGALQPPIDKIFTLEQIADAQRYMESNGQVGKIVVTV